MPRVDAWTHETGIDLSELLVASHIIHFVSSIKTIIFAETFIN